MLDEEGGARALYPTSIPPESGHALRELVVAAGAARTIEVGFALGLSSLYVCDGLKTVGAAGARHVTIDPLEFEVWGDAGLRTVRDAGVEELVEFHRDDSALVLPGLLALGREFDLAFIDGDHRFEAAFVDFFYLARMLRPGGLIVLDDLWLPQVRLVARYFERNFGFERIAVPPAQSPPRERLRFLARGQQDGLGALRKPLQPRVRDWSSFEPFA